MDKKEVLKNIDLMILHYTNMQDITRVNKLKTFKRLINKSPINEYNASISKNGHINMGNIGEKIVLNYLGLEVEDYQHEVKTYILNQAHEIENKNIEVVYFLIMSKYKNGLYKMENAQQIANKKIGVKEFRTLPLEKVCELYDLVK
jgi:hypothetical protein